MTKNDLHDLRAEMLRTMKRMDELEKTDRYWRSDSAVIDESQTEVSALRRQMEELRLAIGRAARLKK